MVMVQNGRQATSADPLDITGDREVGRVRINDETYEMAALASQSLRVRNRINRLLERLQVLEKMDDEQVTEADEREYDVKIRELAQLALPTCPPEVMAKLTQEQAGDVYAAFFVLALKRSPRLQLLLSLNGTKSSPSSNGSTAAIR